MRIALVPFFCAFFMATSFFSSGQSIQETTTPEIFQWSDNSLEIGKNKTLKKKVSDEVADIMLYLIRFSDKANIDIEMACLNKIKKNEKKYPVSKFKGLSKKYNE